MRLLRGLCKAEEGQIVAMFVGFLFILIGLMALSVDLGFFFHTRRFIQNGADASALAGAQELEGCGDGDPIAVATDYALRNQVETTEVADIHLGSYDVEGVAFPTVYTLLQRDQQFYFGQILGLTESPVPAEAEAVCAPASSVAICPFEIVAPNPGWDPAAGGDPYGLVLDMVYPFKFGGGETDAGNFGFLALFGNGANVLRTGVQNGCVGSGELNVVVEEGDVVSTTQPGAIASIWASIDALYSYEGTPGYPSQATCDIAWDPPFPDDAPYGTYAVPTEFVYPEGCDEDPDPTDNVSGRLWPIAIAPDPCPGRSCAQPLEAIAWMYLACWGPRCEGDPPGQAGIYGIFLDHGPMCTNCSGLSNNVLAPRHPVLVR